MSGNKSVLTQRFLEFQLVNIECLKKPYPQALYPFFRSDEAKNFDVVYKMTDSFGIFKDLKDIVAKHPEFLTSEEQRLEIFQQEIAKQDEVVQ